MDNTELYIKYFDNGLSEEEKSNFEKRLSMDIEFKNDFDNFVEIFGTIKKEVKVDERYFATILPNSRKRIDEKQKLPTELLLIYKSKFIIPVILLTLFLVYILSVSIPSSNNLPAIDQIISELDTNTNESEQILNETLRSSNDLQYDQNLYSIVYNEGDYDELLFKYAETNKNAIEINDSLINQLSDNEFNLVFNEIRNKKFNR